MKIFVYDGQKQEKNNFVREEYSRNYACLLKIRWYYRDLLDEVPCNFANYRRLLNVLSFAPWNHLGSYKKLKSYSNSSL